MEPPGGVPFLAPVLSRVTYPLMTGGAVLLAVLALGWGWPIWLIGVVVVVGSSALAALLEKLIPYSAAWARPRGDWGTDLWHYAISNRAADVGTFVAITVFTPVGTWLTGRLGIALWPHDWPLGVQAVLALVLFELPWYWLHRLEHRLPLLWRVHSVHHSGTRMYWWNLSRNHPLDNLVSALASVAVLALVGVADGPLALAAAFSAAHGLLQHANIDLRTGLLDVFFTTARVHRWHHSPRLDESQANYGPTLTLWDHVFGTRRFDPDAVPPEDVGLGPSPAGFPADFGGQLKAPFDRRLWSSR